MFDLQAFNRAVPRYTSYPTAPMWGALDLASYKRALRRCCSPLSLYVHIPFCKTMCLYCACSVVLNRKEENESQYVDYLLKEMDLITNELGEKKSLSQLHFGGGTPTKLSAPLFARIMEKIESCFTLEEKCEIALEIDPRTIDEEKLRFYKDLGINRVSFGVQDTDPRVQEAIKRRQSAEMTFDTVTLAHKIGFTGINIDLIYGLPYQTAQTFQKTVRQIIEMGPDRISLFSYAKVPWLKPHQKAIKEETLPQAEEKFQIYLEAKASFTNAGYMAIGMDHFAKEEDELAISYREKRLMRNFQGYSVAAAKETIGLGMSAIGFVHDLYVQNQKSLPEYYAALEQNVLPLCRGKQLHEDDKIRKWVIHTLMCRFSLDKQEFYALFKKSFDSYFAEVDIKKLQSQGLVEDGPELLRVTELGELLIRIVAAEFDGYLQIEKKGLFSQSI